MTAFWWLLACHSQVEPLKFGSWARYAVALSAPGATGFPVPYTFSLAAAGPFAQAAGASEWGVSLQGGKVCPKDLLLVLWGMDTHTLGSNISAGLPDRRLSHK